MYKKQLWSSGQFDIVLLPLTNNIIPYCRHLMYLDSKVSGSTEVGVLLRVFFFLHWVQHSSAYQLTISVYRLFSVVRSSCLKGIHLQRLILCVICVVGQKTAEILNILRSAECLLIGEGTR